MQQVIQVTKYPHWAQSDETRQLYTAMNETRDAFYAAARREIGKAILTRLSDYFPTVTRVVISVSRGWSKFDFYPHVNDFLVYEGEALLVPALAWEDIRAALQDEFAAELWEYFGEQRTYDFSL